MRGSIPALQIASHGAFYALCLLLHVQGSANATPEVSDGIGVWNKSQVYSKGVFQLESVSEKLCLSAGLSGLSLTSCEPPSSALLWKWVTRHRLFNLGTSRCLGLNATDFLHPVVSMYECDIPLPTMWWRCGTGMLFGAMNNKLAVVNSKVVVRKATLYQWRIFGAAGEGPCAYPYEDIHTLQGNSHGMACSIPFKYNNKWFWDCTSEGREDRHLWCATTNRYDQDEKWGFCPNSVSGCNEFWEGHPELDACYQFNLYSILTWNQALTSCQAQGGSLLSISSSDEQNYIKERLIDVGVVVWMGLNHLSLHGGWQWSDRCPFTLVSYTADLSSRPVHQTQQCGVFNSTGGLWQSLSCESALPYICKKTIQRSCNVEPFEFWQYKETVCPDGWMEHNGFCYQYVDEKASWDGSLSACRTREADLVSIHSLSQQELLLKLLSNVSNSKVWIGLYKEAKLPSVQWSDKTPITFTSWSSLEPSSPKEGKRLCVAADVKHGRWQIVDCEETFPSVCKTTGLVTQHATGEQDEGCPEGWNRKDGWCYKIADQEQTFEDAVKGYYCKAPLVTIENRFEQAFLNSLISQSNRSAFYWTALQDRNRTGEYSWLTQNGSSVTVSYTNWNQYQPVTGGGCVVMSGGKALGHWEVKNCVTFKALAVCKQEVSDYQNTLMPSPHVDVQTSCPAGWDSNAHLADCYKVYHSEKILMHRSWTEAQLFCRALGAELASFHHYEDQSFVKKLLSTMFLSTEGRWFWVGFTKRNPQTDGAWEWSDGTPVVASFIEDMNVGDTQTCAVYSDLTNTLIPQSCDFTFEWICKVPKGVDLVKPYWYSDQHFPWVFFRGAEYYFGSKPFPWETVAFSCKMMGADLLSIHSGDELDFVRERIKKGPDYWWIGLSANSAHNGVSWTDGSALDYENWEKTTLGRKYGQNCIYMSSVSGQWSAGRCEDPYGFVCKRMTVTLVEIPRETHYIGSCPENWFYYGNKCLYLHLPARPEEGKSWTESQSICVSNHGSLVSIEDEIEQAYIVMLLNGLTAGVWIGAEGAGSHKWTNGRSINFRNWETSETFNVPEEPRCTYLSNSRNVFLTGMWQDDVCSETIYGFVCQKTQDITKRPTQPFFIASSLDSSEYKNQTYQLIHGNLSWYAAQEGCREKGAELVSITNPFQQAYLTVLVNRLNFPLWIGLYSADDGASYQWSDGSEPSFIHSEVRDDSLGEPGQGGCVYLNVYGGWKGCDCDRPLSGAICSKSPPKKITCTSGVVCPDNWVKFQRSCYNFESVMLEMTLEESIDHCEKKGNFSKVLTVQDEEESRFLLKEMWNYQQGPQNLWLGIIYNADDDTLAELDDSPLHYTNWHSKPPDASVMRAGTCVTMRVTDVAWQLADCKNRLGFICKTSKGGAKEVEVEPLKGLHQSVISVAAVVAVVLFAVMIGSLWLVYKRNSMSIRRLSTFGSAYYRQTNSHASDQDENVLLPDIETSAGD